MTFNPDTDTTPILDEFLAWLDEDRHNSILAGIGHYENALDQAVEQIESLRAEVDRLTPRVITNPADLEDLPVGTIIIGADTQAYRSLGTLCQCGECPASWSLFDSEEGATSDDIMLPATILHTPEEHQ